MVTPRRTAAAYEFDLARYGGPTNESERDVTVGTSQIELVGPNPDRLMVIIANNGPTAINVSTLTPVTIGRGLPIGAGNLLVLSIQDDGALVTRRLFVVAAQAATPITVIELERSHLGG